MPINQAYNFTVHMKNGDIHSFPHMTLNQFAKEADELLVVDIENIEKTKAVTPKVKSNSNDLLNFIVGKKL